MKVASLCIQSHGNQSKTRFHGEELVILSRAKDLTGIPINQWCGFGARLRVNSRLGFLRKAKSTGVD
jgi:hypothetical protein